MIIEKPKFKIIGLLQFKDFEFTKKFNKSYFFPELTNPRG